MGARDTHPDAHALLVRGYRKMAPAARLERVAELNRDLEELAAARIRRRYGADLPRRELELRLAALRLDRDTMVEVFGWDPRHHGL